MLALVGRTCHVMDSDVKEEEQHIWQGGESVKAGDELAMLSLFQSKALHVGNTSVTHAF